MRALLFILLAPFVALAAHKPPQKTTPIFTKEPVGEAVTVTAVPEFRVAAKPSGEDAAFTIPVRGTAVTFSDIHPLTAKALQDAATKKTPLNFTVQTYRSEGWPSGRIHAQPKLIEKKRPPSKGGLKELNFDDFGYIHETPTIVRITKGDETVYDIDACEVHWEPLRVEALPISYGYPMVNQFKTPSYTVRMAKFPHAERYVRGGCCVTPLTHREQYVCRDCLAGLVAWQSNPIPAESMAGEAAPSPKKPTKK